MGAPGRTTLHGREVLEIKKARELLVQYFDRAVLAMLAARGRRRNRSVLGFFLLVFALSVPFWLIGTVTDLRLLPGLPVSALMFVCPALAAAILVYGANGTAGVRALLRRALDHERIGTKAWYAPVLLLMPGVTVLAYGLMRLVGSPLPSPELPVLALPAMLLAFFVAALGEELGWSGYATDPMQARWGALRAAVLLGSVSAAWHVVPLVQADRSQAWIAWWCLFTVAGRVLILWAYNNAGKSVFAAALFHATSNASWQLFPNHGSHWDPSIVAPIVVFIAAVVTFLWGPGTLARFRY
jgi:membrane protease YdiL (CAAX protease family)